MRVSLRLEGVALALSAAACSSDKSSSTPSPAGSTACGVDPITAANAFAAEAYDGTYRLPSAAQRSECRGQWIAIVSARQNNLSVAVSVTRMVEACEVLGWTCDVLDCVSNPGTYSNPADQAMAAHYDGIILTAIDCLLVSATLDQARSAKNKVVGTLDSVSADLGPTLQRKVAEALLQHPEATAIRVPYRAALLLGAAGAIQQTGKVGKITVSGAEGDALELELIRQGLLAYANVGSGPWAGWAAVDTMNSVLSGKPIADSGTGLRLVDETHGLPPRRRPERSSPTSRTSGPPTGRRGSWLPDERRQDARRAGRQRRPRGKAGMRVAPGVCVPRGRGRRNRHEEPTATGPDPARSRPTPAQPG